MTTVAYKDGLMACDSCWTYGGTVDVLTTKITRLSSGALFGQAGQNDSRALCVMFDKVKTPAQLPTYEALLAMRADFLGLLVLPKGKVYKVCTTIISPENWDSEYEADCGLWEITGPHAAIGSGGDHALVAMECKKNARDAVRMACKFDTASRGPVHVVALKQKGKTHD